MLKTDEGLKKFNKLKKDLLKRYIYRTENIGAYCCCPFCGSVHFIKYGKYDGIQRYMCKECKKTFSNTTNSVWKNLKKNPEKWIKFIELSLQGTTLKNCARILGMSITTAFYWRHKILHAIEKAYKIKTLKESAEVYVFMTGKCYKGSRNKHYTAEEKKIKRSNIRYHFPHGIDVLVVTGNSDDACFVRRTEPNESNKDNFENNVLSIAHKHCYMKFDRTNKYDLRECIRKFNSKIPKKIREKYKTDFHINIQCRSFVSCLNSWKKSFRGIATKYINHYYNFFTLIFNEIELDSLNLFSEILRNGLYISVRNLKSLHTENY